MKWSTESLHPSFFQQLVEWAAKLQQLIYNRQADGISRKEQKQYSVVMGWIRCHLSFAILCSAILCICGSRSFRHCLNHDLNITLATSVVFLYCIVDIPVFIVPSIFFLSKFTSNILPYVRGLYHIFVSLCMGGSKKLHAL